jgi:hypothetical protein
MRIGGCTRDRHRRRMPPARRFVELAGAGLDSLKTPWTLPASGQADC